MQFYFFIIILNLPERELGYLQGFLSLAKKGSQNMILLIRNKQNILLQP